MTLLQRRLIIALDEWLGVLLLCWLRYTRDSLFWPVLVFWAAAVYLGSYLPYWIEEARYRKRAHRAV